MPSGAKKRKAAKKKLQKKANNVTNNNGSHSNSQGSEDPKSYDQRENECIVVERKENVEGRNVEAIIRVDDVGKNGKDKSSSSSSSSNSGSSSNSDDDEIVVEKDKFKEASVDIAGVSEVVNVSVEESIPREESIKQVVSLPQVSTVVSESVAVDNSLTSDVIKSSLQQNVDQFSRPFEEKFVVVSDVEKIADEVGTIKDGCCKNTSENESTTARDDDVLLPQSSDVKAVEECYAGDEGKTSETHKYLEKQPLLASAPVPVRRTSWMNCCGLFEVFSGDSRS